MDRKASRLFVCYVPGLDGRRVEAERTPFVERLRSGCPTVALETHPGSDHLPTVITGVYPHEHRVWQLSLRPGARLARTLRPGDRVPASVSTTLQGIRHLLDRSCDLPAIPARRRRQFDIHRIPHAGRERDARVLDRIGEYPTVFGILAAAARYRYTHRLESLPRLARELPGGPCALEFLEVQALDVLQHWQMDRPGSIDRAYRALDDFIRVVQGRCQERGVTFVLLVDHGQEQVFGSLPLMREIRAEGVPESDYSYFVDLTLARFWFHTEEARRRLGERLHAIPNARLLTLRDLRVRHLAFEDDTFGEVFLAADPGWIFFPNDVQHPFTNLYLGLSDPHQRPRLSGARHRGAHGYLPEDPSEQGYAIVADERLRALVARGELVDVAPTLLELLGESRPSYMRGRVIFG